MKRTFVVLAGCLLAYCGWVALHAQNLPSGIVGSTYITTITDANTGAFSSRSLITLHADHSIAAVDSGQGGPGINFSSQRGAWITSPNAGVIARTFDFSFPNAGIARVDYNFTTISVSQVVGTITLTVFPINADPQGSGGTVVGNFNFTGQRVTVP
jgi:hypothetical protein